MTDKSSPTTARHRRRIASLAAAATAIGMTIGICPAQALGLPSAPDGSQASSGSRAPSARGIVIAQTGIGLPKPGAKYPKIEMPGAKFPKVERPGANYPKVERPGAAYPKVEIKPAKG